MNKHRKSKKSQEIAYYYLYRNDFREALKNFLRAVSFKNTRIYFREESYHDIAYCYENLGDYKNAEIYIQKCLEISPGYLNGKFFLGNMYINMGETEKGEEILEECRKEQEQTKNMRLDLDMFYNTK